MADARTKVTAVVVGAGEDAQRFEVGRKYPQLGEFRDAYDGMAPAMVRLGFQHGTILHYNATVAIEMIDTERQPTALELLAVEIDAFAAECEQAGHTDTGEAWDLLKRIRAAI